MFPPACSASAKGRPCCSLPPTLLASPVPPLHPPFTHPPPPTRLPLQTPGSGALGSLDHPEDARRQMAAESRTRPPSYGNKERQALIDAMHSRMLEMEERSRQLCKAEQQQDAGPAAAAAPEGGTAAQAAAEAATAGGEAAGAAAGAAEQPVAGSSPEPAAASPAAAAAAASPLTAAVQPSSPAPLAAASTPAAPAAPAELRQRPAVVAAPQPASPLVPQAVAPVPLAAPVAVAAAPHNSWEDRGLTYLAVLLVLCIAALLIRKVRLS